MLHIETPSELDAVLATQRRAGFTIGLVPTMGNLHAGHLSLVQAAKAQCNFVVTTIFVNPLQFGPGEDFNRYPRTLDDDKRLLVSAGCDAVFTPTAKLLYPAGLEQQTRISVPYLSTLYCGKTRPGHFDGVCTIVCKLFNMARPDVAFFGLKDFQQFFLIKRMVTDLHMPLQLVGMPTVREPSGLAMSSRNGYLSEGQREQAATLYATLQHASYRLRAGASEYAAVEQEASARLESAGLRPDYFNVVDATTLLPATVGDRQLVLLAAAYAGSTRLIDNLTADLA